MSTYILLQEYIRLLYINVRDYIDEIRSRVSI